MKQTIWNPLYSLALAILSIVTINLDMNNLDKLKKNLKNRGDKHQNESLTIIEALHHPSRQLLPVVVKPKWRGVDLSSWVKTNKEKFDSLLVKHAGILFRGFDMNTLEDFGHFVNSFDTAPIPYMFRSSPRHELNQKVKNVYNSTTYPSGESIRLHNESSYGQDWGLKIIFCCLTPASQGGETPIADSRQILKDIPVEIVEKFRQKGVLYKRKLNKDVGMAWQEVFQTDDKNVVIEVCKSNAIEYQFIDEDHLAIQWVKKAIYQHPVSKEETWFNHIYFFNKFSRYEDLGVDLNEQLPDHLIYTDTLFGDGSEIDKETYQMIKNAYEKNKISFRYEQGDIILLDNMLAAHGRNPYQGDRLIATAIIEPTGDHAF